MTILPKRNKRRLDQREQEPGQNLNPQGNPGALLDVQQQAAAVRHSSHSSSHQQQATGQIDPTRGLNITHSIHHSHHPHFGGHANIQHSHRAAAYNAMLYNHLEKSGHGSRLHPQAAALAVDTKWRSPLSRTSTSSADDKYLPPVKKPKRSRVKQKHSGSSSGYDYTTHKLSDNPRASAHLNKTKSTGDNLLTAAGSVAGQYETLLPFAGPTPQTRQILIPSGSANSPSLAQLSPKMPGGAQQKSGAGQRSKTPESDCDNGGDCRNPPSPGGCNSEDEHVPSQQEDHTEELEKTFEVALKKELGLVIRQMEMDGSCLFRAIADQVYGDQSMHDIVREHCINYMAKNADHFSHYVTEDFTTYLQRKRQLGCHGNHIELQALSEMYNRPIEVYQYQIKPMNIFHCSYRPESAFPIRVSYHRNTHYNSLIDPEKPTIGVGLGLSDFTPRMIEKNLVAETKTSSENDHIEQAMLKDKLRETDWEITDEAINEQVARESYAQWLQDCEKQKRRAPACTVTGPSCSSGPEESVNWLEKLSPTGSPKHSAALSPKYDKEKSSHSKASGSSKNTGMACGGEEATSSALLNIQTETKALFDFEPYTVYNYNDNIDENEALARAIAESQQDYIKQVLKKN